MNPTEVSPLPYTDDKPVGAADFYFAINATFRFVHLKLGREGLLRYWSDLGSRYMLPVTERWRQGGLTAIADYWRAFFAAEPGSEVEVRQEADQVMLEVHTCPAIKHLREHNREIVPFFCQHCYFVSEAAARPAGFTVRLEGGNGSCRQVFLPLESDPAPQDLTAILEAH